MTNVFDRGPIRVPCAEMGAVQEVQGFGLGRREGVEIKNFI